jgi:hypothetical protein|tara:strand:+ start:210 stop:434 length:225 start_codon:yes stop_codon:yes gene_type:complete
MSTYEVETIHYNPFGGVKNKECNLFDDKLRAIAYMRSKIINRNGLVKQGDIKDGLVKLVDDRGSLKELIKFGEL